MPEFCHTSLQLPLLDISQPLLPPSLSTLAQACKDWGFFLITNHGISKDTYERLCAHCIQVFGCPLETKLKVGPSSCINTYTPQFIASPFFESLRVSGPNYFASAKNSSDVLFEPPNTDFCNSFQDYGQKMIELSQKIMALLLRCLDESFHTRYCESEFGKCHGYLRINNYSMTENIYSGEAEGLGMHTDMSCITILYQDEIGGLQVRSREGKWMDVVPREGTLVVNIGDMLQAWSNGRLRSSAHRVLLNKPVNRLSLAFFWCFEDDKIILAPEDLVEEGTQRMYKPFLCLDYVKFRENSEKGRFDKVGYTVDDFAAITNLRSDDKISINPQN